MTITAFRFNLPAHDSDWQVAALTFIESFSQPYEVHLTALSTLPPKEAPMLSLQPGKLTLDLGNTDYQPRHTHGLVVHYAVDPTPLKASPRRYRYHLTLKPWSLLLQQRQNSRVHPPMSLPELCQRLTQSYPQAQLDLSALAARYPINPGWIQYEETDWGFMTRHLHAAGIFYYFRQTEHQAVLVLTETMPVELDVKAEPLFSAHSNAQGFILNPWSTHWSGAHPQTWILTGYDPEHPHTPLMAEASPVSNQNRDKLCHQSTQEWSQQALHQRAQRAQQASACQQIQGMGKSNCPYLQLGQSCLITEKDASTHPWRMIKLQHEFRDPTLCQHWAANHDPISATAGYHNVFTAIPTQTLFKPEPEPQSLPTISGHHTATVVTDPTVGAIEHTQHAGVRVCFHWDKTQTPSAPIRVVQPHAGHQRGWQTLPRRGDEVCVHFINGDPDHPLITASTANANTLPPVNLPSAATQSNLQTHTAAKTRHQLRIEDASGQESIAWISAKQGLKHIGDQHRQTIGRHQTLTINGHQTLTLQHGKITQVAQHMRFLVGNSRVEMSPAGLSIHAEKIIFSTPGAGALQGAVRLGDEHICPQLAHEVGVVFTGSATVFIEGQPAARQSDDVVCEDGSRAEIEDGLPQLLINGQPAVRLNHLTQHGGVLSTASTTVFYGTVKQ